jgi:hypothetical protein
MGRRLARLGARSLGAVLAIIIALVLVACGGGDGDEAAQPTPPPTAVTATTGTESEPPTTATTTTALEPSGRVPTRREIVGTWATAGEALLWRFSSNGRFAFDRVDLEAPFAHGTWTLEGRTIRLVTPGAGCVDEWGWRAGIVKGSEPLDDELEVVFLGEGCGRIEGTRLMLARIAG